MRRSKTAVLVLICVGVLLISGSVTAQNYWMYPGGDKSISVEMFKPKFDNGDDFNLLTTVWFLSGKFKAADRLSIVVEVPVSNLDTDNIFMEDETSVGNPYIGIEARSASGGDSQAAVGRVGVRLPLASDDKWDAASLGLYTAFDRFEAFFPDVLTINASGGYQRTTASGLNYELNVGGELMIPTEDGGDSELYIDYNAAFWVPFEKLSLGGGFTGRLIATEGDLDFGERTVHQLGLAGNYDAGSLKPGVHLRLPLDEDLTDILDFVYGFSLTYNIP